MLPQGVLTSLSAHGYRLDPRAAAPAGSSAVNRCFRVLTRDRKACFLKTCDLERADTLAAEADGLAALRAADALRVPEVLVLGQSSDAAFLLLEYLDLDGPKARAGAALGTALARQHRCTAAQWGGPRDNWIGMNPQPNAPLDDWPRFWVERRLGFQLDLAARNGHARETAERGARLCAQVPRFYSSYAPVPSLLHGDLWGGNWGVTPAGEPVVYDPAVYHGDREADLAMSELFGGFPQSFHAAYRAAWPLDEGYAVRRHLYNLYHVLNHLNQFGASYLRQAVELLDRLLAEC